MSSLAHVPPRGRPASEETPQAIGRGYRVGDIAEWGVSGVELESTQQGTVLIGTWMCVMLGAVTAREDMAIAKRNFPPISPS